MTYNKTSKLKIEGLNLPSIFELCKKIDNTLYMWRNKNWLTLRGNSGNTIRKYTDSHRVIAYALGYKSVVCILKTINKTIGLIYIHNQGKQVSATKALYEIADNKKHFSEIKFFISAKKIFEDCCHPICEIEIEKIRKNKKFNTSVELFYEYNLLSTSFLGISKGLYPWEIAPDNMLELIREKEITNWGDPIKLKSLKVIDQKLLNKELGKIVLKAIKN